MPYRTTVPFISSPRAARSYIVAWLALTAVVTSPLAAQMGGTAEMPGVNDRPNPYRTVEGWATLPSG
ncbi:MAG: hypothetical protein ACKORK_12745, partial [Gemmatimonadota bacterium]